MSRIKLISRETIILLGLGALIVLARLHTYDEPFERDITIYSVIGHELLRGRTLYDDLWEHKPPATMVTFAIGEAIAGPGASSVFFLNILAALLTLAGIYRAGRAGGAGKSAGIWAAVFWMLLCGDLYLQANQPNTEVFMNTCLVWALALWLEGLEKGFSKRAWIVIGSLLSMATLYKQVVAPIALGWAALYWMSALSRAERRTRGAQLVWLGGTVVAWWGGVSLYFWGTHRFQIFFDTAFVFNQYYATHNEFASTSLSGNVIASLSLFNWVRQFGISTTLLLLMLVLGGLTGLLLAWRSKKLNSWTYWIVYVIGAQLAVGLPGQIRPHYFQLLLPPLCLGTAWALKEWVSLFKLGGPTIHAFGLLAAGLLFCHEIPNYRLSPDEWSTRKYGGEFIGTRKMGGFIDRLLAPDETFYEWGSEVGLYYFSHRSPPTLFNSIAVTGGPLQKDKTARVLRDLEQKKPELFMTLRVALNDESFQHPVLRWIDQNYEALPHSRPTAMILMARKGGRLEARLRALPKSR